MKNFKSILLGLLAMGGFAHNMIKEDAKNNILKSRGASGRSYKKRSAGDQKNFENKVNARRTKNKIARISRRINRAA